MCLTPFIAFSCRLEFLFLFAKVSSNNISFEIHNAEDDPDDPVMERGTVSFCMFLLPNRNNVVLNSRQGRLNCRLIQILKFSFQGA